MIENPPDFLFVQTRSPLVTRDIDLLLRISDRVRISITVETDLEHVRKAFTPKAPPIQGRLQALKKLKNAGLSVQAAVSPLLPCSDRFAETLSAAVDRVCIDDYFQGDGSLGKRTGRLGLERIYERLGLKEWYHPDAFMRVVEQFRRRFPAEGLLLSRQGFLP
jgi:DNA repair photolyase